MNDISLLAEAFHTVKLQQQMLVKAIFPVSNKNVKMDKDIQSSLGFDTRGITIYRHSLQANARQALAVSYPTVVQLIGDDLFNHCCRKLLSS
ncbi:putative DNA-binding domain-containing protein, partial [Shewanella sp. SG41-4]|uniref:HvfC/BufC family peptide modification chaperone n=1 Tax=Shewanella sp. SG41-4 TaxID=2760976 RepID=UPI001603D4E9